ARGGGAGPGGGLPRAAPPGGGRGPPPGPPHPGRSAERSPALQPAGAVALRPARDELGEEPRLVWLELGRERLEALDLPFVIGPNRAREGRVRERRRRELLAEEQPGAAQGPLAVERQVAVGDQPLAPVLKCRRRAHHTVREGDPA